VTGAVADACFAAARASTLLEEPTIATTSAALRPNNLFTLYTPDSVAVIGVATRAAFWSQCGQRSFHLRKNGQPITAFMMSESTTGK
jgi:hypothetical protein